MGLKRFVKRKMGAMKCNGARKEMAEIVNNDPNGRMRLEEVRPNAKAYIEALTSDGHEGRTGYAFTHYICFNESTKSKCSTIKKPREDMIIPDWDLYKYEVVDFDKCALKRVMQEAGLKEENTLN